MGFVLEGTPRSELGTLSLAVNLLMQLSPSCKVRTGYLKFCQLVLLASRVYQGMKLQPLTPKARIISLDLFAISWQVTIRITLSELFDSCYLVFLWYRCYLIMEPYFSSKAAQGQEHRAVLKNHFLCNIWVQNVAIHFFGLVYVKQIGKNESWKILLL